jgi:hypothetical protein
LLVTRFVFFFLAALPCAAQDLPDPGRRLTKEEMADPERIQKPKADERFSARKRDAQLCERARVNKQLACGTPNSGKSRSISCTEAYILVEQACG